MQMIFAKIIVLFLFGLIFCLSSAAVTIFCGSLIAEVGGLGYKLWLAVEMGIGNRNAERTTKGMNFFRFSF